jgi:hypothetical protein
MHKMEVSSSIGFCDKEDGRQEHNIGNVSAKISSIFSETYIHSITTRLFALKKLQQKRSSCVQG